MKVNTALKFVIIDDEPLAREVLEGYLKLMHDVDSVSLFSNAENALVHLRSEPADVLLLDIEMPHMTGIEFLQKLSDPPLTIFTTAYRNYAFEGFELGVIDFLLKPIAFQRFSAAIDKVRDFLALKSHNTQLESDPLAREFIFVKSGVKRIKLQLDEITHIQGLKDYAIIYTPTEKIVIKGSVRMVQEMFPPSLFIRVHKSFLVSRKALKRIERNKIILAGSQIPIGRNYRENLDKEINL